LCSYRQLGLLCLILNAYSGGRKEQQISRILKRYDGNIMKFITSIPNDSKYIVKCNNNHIFFSNDNFRNVYNDWHIRVKCTRIFCNKCNKNKLCDVYDNTFYDYEFE